MQARVSTKYFTITDSREIAWVPQLGQMTKIGGDRVRKLQAVCSQVDREIWECVRSRQKFDRHGIVQNFTGTTIRPNEDDGMRSRAKISIGELLGGPKNLPTRVRELNI